MDILSDRQILRLNQEHHYVLDCLEKASGVYFLTGKAGTGKSTLLNVFKKFSDKKLIFLAPTGVAAINIKGQTIHSFFRFPPSFISEKEYKKLPKKLLDQIDWIIIDEISMVRADLLDHIDRILRISRKDARPFGGVPMFWVGDLFQLPPVVSTPEEKAYFNSYYSSPYFFSSKVFAEIENFEMIELGKVFRQEDAYFLKLLNKIRLNELDYDELESINDICLHQNINLDLPFSIILCTTNYTVRNINLNKLEKIKSPPKVYKASIQGSVNPGQFPTDEMLILKVGAQVMLLRNDSQKKYVNGSLGIITKLNDNTVELLLEGNEETIEIEPNSWEVVKYKAETGKKDGIIAEVSGSFKQLPLKLAWAVTIHKSQGKTFDKALIDMGTGAFEYGQTYVALSRCKSLEGIQLKQPLKMKDIRTDDKVVDFIRHHN